METVIQMDIFFFVTTIAVILLTVLHAVLLVYLIKLLRDARTIVDIIRDEAGDIIEDVEELRENVKHKAKRFSGLLGAVTTARFIKRVLKGKDE